MGIESGTYINDLVTTNPIGASDPVSDGDNHIRLIKSVIRATFPGMAGAAWRVQSKSANYTVLSTDNMSIFRCTGASAFTLTMSSAATLGNGFMIFVFNDTKTGTFITIDPSGSETISGNTFGAVMSEQLAMLFSDGTNLYYHQITSAKTENPFVNSDLQLFSRGIFTATAAGTGLHYHADRFFLVVTGATASANVTQHGTAVSLEGGRLGRGLKLVNRTAKTQATNDVLVVSHKIEGNRFVPFAPNPFTISFWMKSSLTGTYSLSLTNTGLDQSYVKSFTLTAANTFELKQIQVPIRPGAGTWDFTNGVGIEVRIALASGSGNIVANDNVWTAVNAVAGTAVVNWQASVNNTAVFAGFQMEAGFHRSPYLPKARSVEIIDCLRYFNCSIEKEFGLVTSGAGLTGAVSTTCIGQAGSSHFHYIHPVPMRVKPTSTLLLNPSAFNTKVRNTSRNIDSGTPALAAQSKTNTVISVAPTTSDSAGDLLMLHIALDAEC
jgi:hypothetical protein